MKEEYRGWKITISKQMRYKGNNWLGTAYKKNGKNIGFNVDGCSIKDTLNKIMGKIDDM